MAIEQAYSASLTVMGHPLIQTISVSWFANHGMVNQSLVWDGKGGFAQADLVTAKVAEVLIGCRLTVAFTLPKWGLFTLEKTLPFGAGGQAMVIDLSQWIQCCTLALSLPPNERLTDASSCFNHLIVNATWQSPGLAQVVSTSGRITPTEPLKIYFLQDPHGPNTSGYLSGLGAVHHRMVQLPKQPFDLQSGHVNLTVAPGETRVRLGNGPVRF
jgi:hypothetical protein